MQHRTSLEQEVQSLHFEIQELRIGITTLNSLKKEKEQLQSDVTFLTENIDELRDEIEIIKHKLKLKTPKKRFPGLQDLSDYVNVRPGTILPVNYEGQYFNAIIIHSSAQGIEAVILDSKEAEKAGVEGKYVTLEMEQNTSHLQTPHSKFDFNFNSMKSVSQMSGFDSVVSGLSHKSQFYYHDIGTPRVEKMEKMFSAVSERTKNQVLERTMSERRIDAISTFCDVDYDTANDYLQKHEFNPEPVVDEIDRRKTMKYNILWIISSTIVFFAALYFIGFDLFVKYSDKAGSTLWTPSFQSTSERPLELPIVVVNVAGIPTNMTSPFQIILKKQTDENTEDNIYCGPEVFQEDCWGNSEDVLVCSDGLVSYTNESDFTWAACRRPGVSRVMCPKSYPIMCNNPFANQGIEHVCESQGNCAIDIYGGPRICKDGRNLASLYGLPSSCTKNIVDIENDFDSINFGFATGVRVFRFATMLVIFPPNETLAYTRDEYFLSFRVFFNNTMPKYGLRYQTYHPQTLQEDNVQNWNDLLNYFYEDQDANIQELPAGSKSIGLISPMRNIDIDGNVLEAPVQSFNLHTNTFQEYQTAISLKLATNRVTITTESAAADFVNDFIGPAGGFICLLLRIQTAILAFVLAGFYFPTYSGGRTHLFGWQVNFFNEEYRKKLLLFMNIYDPQVADETEGIEMLRARVVSWPTNKIKGSILRS